MLTSVLSKTATRFLQLPFEVLSQQTRVSHQN